MDYYVGQEGVGGIPFPYVESIHLTDRDELVVVTREAQAWRVFWYTKNGELVYHVEIDLQHLPDAADAKSFSSLEKIVPDMNTYYLYLMLYYYAEEYDESTGSKSAIQNTNTLIYRLDIQNSRYDGYVEVPEEGIREVRVGARIQEISAPSFELLGITSGGHFFLLRNEDLSRYLLLILDSDGKVEKRGYIFIEDTSLAYKLVAVERSGLLFALLCNDYQVQVVWWRCDKFLKNNEAGEMSGKNR